MAYQYTANPDIIVDIDTGTSIPLGHYLWPADGTPILPAPAPTMQMVADAIRDGIQAWLDATAQQNNYDDAASAVSYAGDPNATFNADGIAIRDWRSAVWTAAYILEATLRANPPTPWPTSAQIIAQLPQASSYGWVNRLGGTP
jgi:hypothetical protein